MTKSLKSIKGKLFENIFTHAKEGIAIVGLKGDWIKVNGSILNTLGYTESELYAMTFKEITHKDDLKKDLKKMNSLLDGKIENYAMNKRYFHKNGHVLWARLSVSLVRDDDHRPIYFISQISDISKQINSELKLKSMLDIAKEQNDKLSDFAEIITHNLKTHAYNLNTLVSFIAQDLPEIIDKEEFLMLKDSVINLSETVSHLTEIAKIKSHNYSDLQSLNFKEYIDKSIYNVSALAKNANSKIVNKVTEDFKVKAIPAYLDSIILNFLTNAIKYRSLKRQLQVNIDCKYEGKYIVLKICDNGLGLDLKKFGNKLFSLYKTFHYNTDATGVGLFITKNHVESLGGFIEVKSEVDIGTTFFIYLLRG